MEELENENLKEKIREILRALRAVKYGSVEITIHASEIVQIETREKVRFVKQTVK
jgi:hypothetical protein